MADCQHIRCEPYTACQLRGISYSCDEGDCRDCGHSDCDHFCHLNQEYQFPYGWRIREGYDQRSSDGD